MATRSIRSRAQAAARLGLVPPGVGHVSRMSRVKISPAAPDRETLAVDDSAYPARTAIKLILDNHSAHIVEGNQSLACRSASAPLRIHFRPQSRLLAQSRRGLLLETRPFRPATHSRLLQAAV